MEYFVDKDSVVRKIWGSTDTILFIFAGASAEFALNKAVDWLYFTGRLPADPLGRLFTTVSYARTIVFSEKQVAVRAIQAMATIHANVEKKRAATIPDWAYRDVLFMLIDYSIRAFEVLERKMSQMEKDEVFQVFNRMGGFMGIKGLPDSLEAWEQMRQEHIEQHLQHSTFTDDLFRQYRKHLGSIRYKILLETQSLVVPRSVNELLHLRETSHLYPLLELYKMSKSLKADGLIRALILPSKYKKEIRALETQVPFP